MTYTFFCPHCNKITTFEFDHQARDGWRLWEIYRCLICSALIRFAV